MGWRSSLCGQGCGPNEKKLIPDYQRFAMVLKRAVGASRELGVWLHEYCNEPTDLCTHPVQQALRPYTALSLCFYILCIRLTIGLDCGLAGMTCADYKRTTGFSRVIYYGPQYWWYISAAQMGLIGQAQADLGKAGTPGMDPEAIHGNPFGAAFGRPEDNTTLLRSLDAVVFQLQAIPTVRHLPDFQTRRT